MRLFPKLLMGLCMAFVLVGKSHAYVLSTKTERLQIEVGTESQKVNEQQQFHIVVRFAMKNGWHIFAQETGDVGYPTKVNLNLPTGYQIESFTWSKPKEFVVDGIRYSGYENQAFYEATIQPDKTNLVKLPLDVELSWLACGDECVPEKVSLTLPLNITDYNVLPDVDYHELQEKMLRSFKNDETQTNDMSWPQVLMMLIMAFLGGFILNFMPCVFPILFLKVLSLVQGRQNHCQLKRDSILYGCGVVLSFLIIAGILAFLRQQGQLLGWGFQLQSPIFVGCMLVVFILVFLLLLDWLPAMTFFANSLGRLSMVKGKYSSFLTGLFAVLVASPCTAPFMGIAIGYTLFQPLYVYFPIFLFLALGYALPFTLIGFFPKVLYRILPKPGMWMIVLKKIFAIPVLATCVWLAWVLINQLNAFSGKSESVLEWQHYDEQKVAQVLEQGRPVFVNFTAKWCLTCLANEQMVFSSKKFAQLVEKKGIVLFKADWTNKDEKITLALEKYQRNSIPLYVWYPKGSLSDYVVLPQLLTPQNVENYLE